jgi:hypothetical protein
MHFRKGTAKLARLQIPLDAGLLLDDEELEKLLPSHSTGSGVVSINGGVKIFGKSVQWSAEGREEWRAWRCSGQTRVSQRILWVVLYP